MSYIKATNDFGNTVSLDYDRIKAVKYKNEIFQVLYENFRGETSLIYVHNANKPAMLRGFEARQKVDKEFTIKRNTSTKQYTRCKGFSRSLVRNKIPYIKVYEAHS